MMGAANALINEFERQHRPRERRQYLIDFPGFAKTFAVRLVRADPATCLELPPEFDSELRHSASPHLLLADKLTRAISLMEPRRTDFDVLMIVIPDAWEPFCYGPEGDDFDLHDYLKAVTASRGIPLQVVQEGSALAYQCRCSVMWRLGIALYCKAGGVPWRLADAYEDTAFVGLSYAIKPEADKQKFVTCCSQVFDADGVGLEFIAYETGDFHIERKNPYLSRGEMRRVMARSLAMYQRRHAGRGPRRVVIHKTTEFKPEEVEGCFDAWPSAEGVELIQVQSELPWRGVRLNPPKGRSSKASTPDSYPVLRGTCLSLGGREVLLWTQGNAPSASVDGSNFFKEGKGIPSPLKLVRFAGHGGWYDSCRAVVGLSKMNWNNDSLYDRMPVTLGFAQTLARTIKRMPVLGTAPYQIRFFM
jgi:hypothetical protein